MRYTVDVASLYTSSFEIFITEKQVREMGDVTAAEGYDIYLQIPELQPKVTVPVIELFS